VHSFHQEIEEHLSIPVPALQSWIDLNWKLIAFSIKAAKKQAKLNNKSINDFFRKKGKSRSKIQENNHSKKKAKQTPQTYVTHMSIFFITLAIPTSWLRLIPEHRPSRTDKQPAQAGISSFFKKIQTIRCAHIKPTPATNTADCLNQFPDHPS
jgi:hypothetical protein